MRGWMKIPLGRMRGIGAEWNVSHCFYSSSYFTSFFVYRPARVGVPGARNGWQMADLIFA